MGETEKRGIAGTEGAARQRQGREERRGSAIAERINSHRDLRVYKGAMDAAMEVFRISKAFPMEERYSMVDQLRRSSRSVCANLAEAWRKRRYRAAFTGRHL